MLVKSGKFRTFFILNIDPNYPDYKRLRKIRCSKIGNLLSKSYVIQKLLSILSVHLKNG